MWIASISCVCTLALCLNVPASAHASSVVPTPDNHVRGVAVFAFPSVPTIPDHVRTALERRLHAELERSGVRVIEPAKLTELATTACEDNRCRARLASKFGVSHALVPSITVTHRDYSITLELVALPSGEPVLVARDECEICGFAEVEAMVGGMAASLHHMLAAVRQPPPRLTVETTPPGAKVELDGRLRGTTPFELEVEPGAHELTITKPGYIAQHRKVTFVDGVRERMQVELQARPPRVVPPWIGWSALGLGAAAAGAGATLVVLDESPVRMSCNGMNVDADDNCRFRYDTLAGGIGLLAAGAVLIGTGLGLVMHARRVKASRQDRARVSSVLWGMRVSF